VDNAVPVPELEPAVRESDARLGHGRVFAGRFDPIGSVDLARPIKPVQPVR